MTKSEKIRLFYCIFLGVLTVVIGALFIFSAADIYFSPDGAGKNYTREIVGAKLRTLLIPVCLWIAAIIAGFVLSVVYPQNKRTFVRRSARETLTKLSRRLPAEGDSVCFEKYKRATRTCLIVHAVCAAVCLLAAVMCGVYLFQTAHFPADDLNAEVLHMLKNVLPWVAVAFAACIGTSVYSQISAKKELPVVKQLIASGKGAPLVASSAFESKKSAALKRLGSKYVKLGVRLAVFVLGVTFVMVGIFNGDAQDVLQKAINICTECIGLG